MFTTGENANKRRENAARIQNLPGSTVL